MRYVLSAMRRRVIHAYVAMCLLYMIGTIAFAPFARALSPDDRPSTESPRTPECVVGAISARILDAASLEENANRRAAFLQKTRDLSVRIGNEAAPPKITTPPRPTKPLGRAELLDAPVRQSFGLAGGVAQGQGLTETITVQEGGKSYQMLVPRGTNPRVAQASFLAAKELERTKENPLITAVDGGDLETLKKLIAQREDVRGVKDRYGHGGLVGRAVARWYADTTRESQPDSELRRHLDRRNKVAATYVNIVKVLVAAGVDPSDSHEGGSALLHISSNIRGEPNPPGAMELTRFLLEHGAPLLSPGNSFSALDRAIERDNQEMLDVMLRHGHPDQHLKNGALVTAVQGRNWKASLRLLEAGADPSVTPSAYGKCCDQPLLDYVLMPRPVPRDLLKAMIAHKVNPNVTLRTGYTPLMHVLHDHELMEAFLDLGADPNAKVDYGFAERVGDTVLHLATRGISSRPPGWDVGRFAYDRIPNPETHARSVELLLRYGAKPDVLNKEGMTPLMLTSPDDAKIISLLIKAGGHSINTAAGEARHYSERYKVPVGPVIWALLEGNETLATQLVRGNSALQDSDCGAIFIAAAGGAETTLSALLDLNTPWNAVRGTEGETPLIAAARAAHVSTVKLLLDRHAANVNDATPLMTQEYIPGFPQFYGGYTALIEATRSIRRVRGNKHIAVVEVLIKHGADVNHVDYSGRTAMDYARSAKADDIIILLRQSGARR